GSVDSRHTGSASSLNSAIARTGVWWQRRCWEAFLAAPVTRSSVGSMPLRLFARLHRLQPQRARFSSSPLAPRQNEAVERYLKDLGLPSSANLVVVEL